VSTVVAWPSLSGGRSRRGGLADGLLAGAVGALALRLSPAVAAGDERERDDAGHGESKRPEDWRLSMFGIQPVAAGRAQFPGILC